LDEAKGHRFGGDALIALSKASGVTIVYEDYDGGRKMHDVRSSFGKEMSFRDALTAAVYSVSWKFRNDLKAMIGADFNWVEIHRNLLPQRLIDNLAAKADGDGIDLDDLTELAKFPPRASEAWLVGETFQGNPFSVLSQGDLVSIWAFYYSLSPREKDQAKSSAGLSLSKHDPNIIAGMLADRTKSDYAALHNFGDQPPGSEQMMDSAALSSFVMRLKWDEYYSPPPASSAGLTNEAKTKSDKPIEIPVGFTMLRNYYILMEGAAANKISLRVPGLRRLPFFSPKRTKELSQAFADQKAAAAQPAVN
jgi:hypothetical protein